MARGGSAPDASPMTPIMPNVLHLGFFFHSSFLSPTFPVPFPPVIPSLCTRFLFCEPRCFKTSAFSVSTCITDDILMISLRILAVNTCLSGLTLRCTSQCHFNGHGQWTLDKGVQCKTWRNRMHEGHEICYFETLLSGIRCVVTKQLFKCKIAVIGTLAVDGWAATFSTARRGLGGLRSRPVPFSLYQL